MKQNKIIIREKEEYYICTNSDCQVINNTYIIFNLYYLGLPQIMSNLCHYFSR